MLDLALTTAERADPSRNIIEGLQIGLMGGVEDLGVPTQIGVEHSGLLTPGILDLRLSGGVREP